ncbi:aldehyde dehydrogenase family protein [Streptomyces sp. NPDC096311]|uniref:aldehyde dehydrogenase family protein n=1 Tax=Streptomyces sp. NPDC096311 TaxID=3366083 RepID=UPI003801929F
MRRDVQRAKAAVSASGNYDEIFGQATVIHVVDSADEAVTPANDTPYGQTAGVITENLATGLEVARRLRTGIVHAFGGPAGAEAFTDTRWITAQTSGHGHYPI